MTTLHTQTPRILVVDDDPEIRRLLEILLTREGYRVSTAPDGSRAVAMAEECPEDISLIILDIMMPGLDGTATARLLRELTDAPILFLTARSSDTDKTTAYSSGGDDYVVKPFHTVDLKLKVAALLGRYLRYREGSAAHRGAQEPTARVADGTEDAPPDGETAPTAGESAGASPVLLPGGIEWHPAERTGHTGAAYRNGERVALTERECALLARLLENRGETLSPATLYEEVWGEPYLASSSNTVIVHIANLRRKLERDSTGPSIIRTVWGRGYRID